MLDSLLFSVLVFAVLAASKGDCFVFQHNYKRKDLF